MPHSNDTSNSPVRILILESDRLPRSHDGHNSTSVAASFQHLFTEVGKSQSPPISVEIESEYIVGKSDDPNADDGGNLPDIDLLEGFKGVLITGSKHDAHGDARWIKKLVGWLREAWKKYPHIRFSGVCFGHQILSRLLGGNIAPHPTTWELAHTEIKLTDIGKKIFRTSGDTIHLHEFHQDFVQKVPTVETSNGLLTSKDELKVWGSSKDCEVQGLYLRKRLLTTQGHVGWDEGMVKESIEEAQKRGDLPKDGEEEVVEKAKEETELEHDGDKVVGAVLRFMAGWDDEFE